MKIEAITLKYQIHLFNTVSRDTECPLVNNKTENSKENVHRYKRCVMSIEEPDALIKAILPLSKME